jgi:hypothetical protein
MPVSRPYQSSNGIVAQERSTRQCQPSRKQRDKCHPRGSAGIYVLRRDHRSSAGLEGDVERMSRATTLIEWFKETGGGLLRNPNNYKTSTAGRAMLFLCARQAAMLELPDRTALFACSEFVTGVSCQNFSSKLRHNPTTLWYHLRHSFEVFFQNATGGQKPSHPA